jgi:iron complex transport system ATP-binding protein
MDEPTASLDLANRLMVLGRIEALEKDGLAVLVATHEPEQAFAVADRAAILGHGDHFVTGPVGSVLTPDELTRLYGVTLTIERTPSGRLVVTPAPAEAPG